MQKNVNMDGAVFLKKVLPAPICTNLHVSKNRGMTEEVVAHCQVLHMLSACSRKVVAAL